MKQDIQFLLTPEAHPYPWLSLDEDGFVQFGHLRPTKSPTMLYKHWRPTPYSYRCGFEMEHVVSGVVERFDYHPPSKQWKRTIQLEELTGPEEARNGVVLQPDGSILLEHNQVVFRHRQVFKVRHEASGRTFTQTNAVPATVHIQQDSGLSWEYTYEEGYWHRVLPYQPAKLRQFIPPEDDKTDDNAVLAPICEPIPSSGELQIGPVTLYGNGGVLFGDTLYSWGDAIPMHEHLGFTATRKSGLRTLLTIQQPPISGGKNFPLLLRYEGFMWYRYVSRPPTFYNRLRHAFDDARRPLLSVKDFVVFTVVMSVYFSYVLGLLIFGWMLLQCLVAMG